MLTSVILAVVALMSPDWKVEVQSDGAWRDVPVRTIPVGAGVGQTPRTNGTATVTCDGLKWYCSMARDALCEVEWKKDLKVRVSWTGDEEARRLLPVSLSVSPKCLGFGPFSGTGEMSFAKPAKLLVKADGDNVHALSLLFRNPDGTQVLVAACQTGRGAKDRTGADAYEPRPKLYIRYKGEYKHLPLPFGTWSVTTVVFK